MTGHIHVYTGNGKGKTAAAMGLAMRAIGAGFKVYIAQFLKGNGDNSLQDLGKISKQVLLQKYGDQGQPLSEIRRDDRQKALEVLDEICEVIHSGDYQLVILDDANIAVCHGFLMVEDLLKLIDSKPKHVDVIITGDCAAPQIIKRADLVTDMQGVKMGPDLPRADSIN
jgi:cob(I)alamin adenosyltransferase